MNIIDITHWQDVVVLLVLAYVTLPIAKFSANVRGAEEEERALPATARPLEHLKRFAVSELVSGVAKVALSAYVVDVLCVALTTIGFGFPHHWDLSSVYTKTAYSVFALRRFLQFKTAALCKFYKVRADDMGRVEILDRVINGIAVSLVSLLLFDWLSVRMGMAFKGLLAFSSVGTLAFTIASQGLVSQLMSGFFLAGSSKVYNGEVVQFGDGTQGQVVKMGWMETVIRGPDNTITSVPNSNLANQKISNFSRVRMSQVKQTLRFHYEDADEIPALLETIRSEIKKNCPKLVTDGSRPFRVFWTGYNEDHLEVMVDTHFYIPPIGDPYWHNRQRVLMAINQAVKKHNLEFAKLYRFEPAGDDPTWRVISQGQRKVREETWDDDDLNGRAEGDEQPSGSPRVVDGNGAGGSSEQS